MTEIKCYCGHTITCDCGPLEQNNTTMKHIKKIKSSWKDQALKRSNIRGEHAYLEGVEDFKNRLLKELNKYTFNDIAYEDLLDGIYKAINIIKNLKP
tara:strand:+ start:203 stop:493 length:291 start_codon:yes stop_codon:yes gene_type:complete